MHRLTLLFVLLLCTGVRGSTELVECAQNFPATDTDQLISGVITDAKNGYPLPYVNVFLQSNQSRGVLTNEKGEFTIRLSAADRQDQLVFSLLSYQTHTEPVANVLDQGFFNHQMTTSFVRLDEVVVISDNGLRKFMEQVFVRIPDNYGADYFTLHAYARGYQIDDGRYSQFVEAMVNIGDQQYGWRDKDSEMLDPKYRATQFRMVRDTLPSVRDSLSFLKSQYWLTLNYALNVTRQGNYNLQHLDRAPDGTASLVPLDLTFLEGMKFSNRGQYRDGQDTIIRIGYRPNDRYFEKMGAFEVLDSAKIAAYKKWFEGEFLVNKKDFAIIRKTVEANKYRSSYYDVLYQKTDGKYYVKQLTSHGKIKEDGRQLTYQRLLFVIGVTTGKRPARRAMQGKLLDPSEDIADLRLKYDADFWRNNHFLQRLDAPEEMRLSMARMQRQAEGMRK